MAEKITPEQQSEDISLGYYGRYETMPVAGALSRYRDYSIMGPGNFEASADRMQILNTVANATDAQIDAWAKLTAKTKDLDSIGFFQNEAKKYRAAAQKELEIEPKPPLIQ